MTPTQTALVARLRAGGGSIFVCPFAAWVWAPGSAPERLSAATVKALERQGAIRISGGRLPVARLTLTDGGTE